METNRKNSPAPTFGGSFSNGWEVMSRYFLVLLLVVLVLGIIISPSFFRFNFNVHNFNWDWNEHNFDILGQAGLAAFGIMALILGLIIFVYSLLIVPVFRYGARLMFVHAARDTRPQFETLVKGFKENYLYIVLANLLTAALIMLAFIFLIIPGIIVACRLAFVSYLVMDKKLDPIIAVEESWRMTKGHGWTIFFMAIVSFFIFIGGMILFGVGILPAIMWVKSSFASLYQAVLIQREEKAIND